jgi:hypothetical protein
MKTRHTKLTNDRKSGSVRTSFSIGKFSFSILNFQFSILLFCLLTCGSAWGQFSISPQANPAQVVVMGDLLEFKVNILSQTAYSGGRLEVILPQGFKLDPAGFVAGTLSADRLSGKIVANVEANKTLELTFHVQPLCNAATAVANNAERIINYKFYQNSTATTPIANGAAATDPIANFYAPILNVVYPAGVNVVLNTTVTRVIEITQTANSSHVNNLRIDAAVTDKAGIVVSKIEVSRDGSSNWTDITASGLDASQAGKYVYTITKANTFGLAKFNYPGQQLRVGEKVYIRETVILRKCNAGAVNYSVSVGDGADFCSPLPAAAGNVNLVVSTPTYGNDILNGSMTWPVSPSVDGAWRVRILNTATTDPNAIMKDIYLEFGTNSSQYYMKKAYICNSSGALISGSGGATDTIWLALNPGTGTRRIDVNLASTNPAMQTIYENIGFIDADGDGIYNDLNINKTVDIMIIFNITTGSLSTNTCNSSTFIPGISTIGWGYHKVCDSYVRFGRAYANGGASWWHDGLMTSNIKNSMLSPALIRTGDKATLSFLRDEMLVDNFLQSRHGVSGTSTYYTDITLPAGLDFDTTAQYPVILKNANGAVYSGVGGNISWNSGYITRYDNQHIRVRILPALFRGGTYMEIAVKANGASDNGSFSFVNLFDYGNTGNFYRFGCFTPTVDYILADNCSDIEIMGLSVERTSFGYTDKNKTARITKADNPNVSVIYPFDSVTIYTQMAVRGNSSIAAVTDTLKLSASYRSNGSGTGNAYISKVNVPGRLLFFRGGAVLHTLSIPATDITQRSLTSGGINIQYIETNISKTLRNAGVTQLQTGDSLSIIIYTLSTEALPPANNEAARPVTMTVYKNSNKICYPLIDDKVKFLRYTFDYVLTDNTDAVTSWQERNHSTSSDLFYGSHPDRGGSNLLTAGEYRPNVDTISNITFVYNCLIKVNRIWLTLSNPLAGNETARTLATNEYTVTYSGGKTTIVINPLKDHMFTGLTTRSWTGYYLHVDWDAINMANNFQTTKTVSFTSTEYPTSATPKRRNYNKTIGTDHKDAVIDFYKINVISGAPVQSPLTSTVEWPLSIENNSAWVNANPVFPNTWIAFEVPSGVTPSKLIDVTDGGTVVADIGVSGQFLPYGPSGQNYYWVKLNDVSCPTPHEYKLQCTYTVCSGTPTFAVKVGMSKTAYPQDPYNSYAQAPYNSSKMAIHASSSCNLSFTPPTVDFSGILTHRPGPSAQNKTDGTNAFCDTVGFFAEFHNGLSTEVSDLRLRVTLPSGFTYDNTRPAQVKFGTGVWATLPAGQIQTSAGLLTITLSNSNQKLTAYQTPDASAYVDFRLKIACGTRNKEQIYTDFIGKSGCGVDKTKLYNSGQIRIAGLSDMADYWVTQTSSKPTPVYTGTISPNLDGSFTVTGNYRRAENAGGDDLQAIVELPKNLQLVSSTGGLIFTQTGTQLISTLPSSDAINTVRDFTLTFRPINPLEWNEDKVKITFHTGFDNVLSCGGTPCTVSDKSDALTEIEFDMQMLDVRFSDKSAEPLTAVSKYNSSTTEHVEIKGWLRNYETAAEFAAGQLKMELWTKKSGVYTPVTVSTTGLTVASVAPDNSTPFTVVADIPNTDNFCDMILVLCKKGGGTSNPYLSDSVAVKIIPQYEFGKTDSICQMVKNTPVGDQPITGYSYSWSPSNYLSATNTARVNFTYDYATTPVTTDSQLEYTVTITRPGSPSCTTTGKVTVPLKGIPSVNTVNNVSLCNGGALNVTFADPNPESGKPTTFSWTATDISAIGGFTPTSGTGNISIASLTNATTAPITAKISVTPTKNGCTGVTKTFTVTVNPTPKLSSSLTPSAICSATAFAYTATSATTGTAFSWTRAAVTGISQTAGSGTSATVNETLTNTTTAPINVKYVFTLTANGCTNTQDVTVEVYGKPDGGTILANQTICHNTKPAAFTSSVAASGGTGTRTYTWQWSTDGTNWTDFASSNSETYTHNANLTTTTKYRRRAVNTCGTIYSNTITVTVRHPSLYNYPDIRIRVCPDAGVSINLSKYIDTLAVTSLQWKSVSPSIPIDPTTGTIATDNFNAYTSVYTLSYTVDNPCIIAPVERKVYLDRLKSGRMRPLRDTVAICYKLAERLQLNQLFGIDAAGTWSFDSSADVTPYITRLTSPTYNGAVVMNGKAIYDNLPHDYNYHGILTNRVRVTYTTGSSSCLKGKSYTITIILTPDITE